MKRKILFIMGCLENGGGERSLVNLLQVIDYKKYDIDLLLFKERGIFMQQLPPQVNILTECDELHFLYTDTLKHAVKITRPYLSFIHVFGTILSKLKSKSGFHKGQYRWEHFYSKAIPTLNKRYDVAISYLEGETMLYLVDKVCASKKISWIHTDYSKINADIDFELRYLKKLDKIVTISDMCARILKEIFPDISEKLVVLPNLINSKSIHLLANEFYPMEYDRNILKIVSVGRLVELKGFDMAIKAAHLLKEQGFEFEWFVLGEGTGRRELELLIRKYNVKDCFKLLGTRENPYAYMYNADVIVQTSRYEGKSIVLDEAKILRKPIVVTNYDTVSDQIDSNEGIIVEMDPTSIANGIREAVNKKEDYLTCLHAREYGNQELIKDYCELFDC